MLRKAIVGAVLALAATSGAIAAAPAQANPVGTKGNQSVAAARYVFLDSDDPCPDGYFCAFDFTFFGGNGVGFFNTELNWGTIPTQFRFINNNAESGLNFGFPGAFEDVFAYPLPNHRDDPRFPGVCVQNNTGFATWHNLLPESNKWFNAC